MYVCIYIYVCMYVWYVQRPLQRLRAYSVVEVLERVAREVVAVIEVGQVVYELRARHAAEGGAARRRAPVQVRVQQHYCTRQRVHCVYTIHTFTEFNI